MIFFRKLKKAQKTWIQFFVSSNRLKNMVLIFCKLKKKKTQKACFQFQKHANPFKSHRTSLEGKFTPSAPNGG